MSFDITQVLDLQSVSVQGLLGYLISLGIDWAVKSNLPVLRAVQKSWARSLSVGASALVAIGIHISWTGGWDVVTGGTLNLSLMVPGLSDLVNTAYQFMSNEIAYRVFRKPKATPLP